MGQTFDRKVVDSVGGKQRRGPRKIRMMNGGMIDEEGGRWYGAGGLLKGAELDVAAARASRVLFHDLRDRSVTDLDENGTRALLPQVVTDFDNGDLIAFAVSGPGGTIVVIEYVD